MKSNRKMEELFYNYPTKHWHFEELLQEAGLSRAQTNVWLKKLIINNLVIRLKQKGKMPYYIANYQHPHYQNSKRLYAWERLHESGLLDYLVSLDKAEVIILFGSFSRWDWYDNSDVDIFVYGNIDKVYVGKFMPKLKREIQIFSGKDRQDLKQIGSALLKNIIKGITIKGTLPQEVINYATV
ncbi:nucleotidyltransferase domain-containing protein [Candidatus Woesearchaeota archaeon]|nr:nucleotidyltransferase domain-containing protein [Candidatus Woesearchaeota archaeon]